jgi:prevent-host-death family protein
MADADPKKKVFNVHEAKTHFSKLIDRAHAGEEIVVAKDGVPYVRLVRLAAQPRKPRQPGRYKHLLKDVPSDIWFEPTFTEDELDEFERKILNP